MNGPSRPAVMNRAVAAEPERQAVRAGDQKHDFVSWLLFVALPLVIFFLAYGAVNWAVFSSQHAETSDYAVTGLQVWRASRFQEFLGPYSRFHFNHPGPIFFYLYAAGENVFWFLGSPFGKYLLTQLLLNFACLLAAMHSIYVTGRARYEPALLLVCYLLALRALPNFIHADIWGAAVLIAPALAFLLSASGFAQGAFRLLPLVTISATLLVQQHISTSAIVLPIAVLSLSIGGWKLLVRTKPGQSRSFELRNHKVAIAAGLLIPLLAFSLPLYNQLFADEGNVSKLFRFFQSQDGESLHSEREAARFVFGFYLRPLPGLSEINPLSVFVVLLVCCALLVWQERDRLFLALSLVLGLLFSLYAARRIVGEMMEYLLWTEYALVALFYFLVLLVVISFFGWLRSTMQKREAAVPLLVACALPFLVIKTQQVPAPEFNRSPGDVVAAVKPDPQRMYQIVINPGHHHDEWPLAAGVLLHMVREGGKVCVPEGWTFMFGDSMRCPPNEKTVPVLFYSIPHAPAVDRAGSISIGNSRVDFGDLKTFAVPFTLRYDATDARFTNFSSAENGLRWTEGRTASLHFAITPEAIPEQCTIRIKGFGNGRQPVTVSLNGTRLGDTVFEKETNAEFRLPGSLLKPEGNNQLLFDLPLARRPPNGDPRLLALAFTELELRSALPGQSPP